MPTPQLEAVIRAEPIDSVQLNYSIDNRAVRGPAAAVGGRRGVAVLVDPAVRRRWTAEAPAGQAAATWASELGCRTWAQILLKYVIAIPRSPAYPRHQPPRAHARERGSRDRRPPRRRPSTTANGRGPRLTRLPHVMPRSTRPGRGLASPDGLDRVARHRAAPWVGTERLAADMPARLVSRRSHVRQPRRRRASSIMPTMPTRGCRRHWHAMRASFKAPPHSHPPHRRSTAAAGTRTSRPGAAQTSPGMVGIGFTPRVRHEDFGALARAACPRRPGLRRLARRSAPRPLPRRLLRAGSEACGKHSASISEPTRRA